MNRDDIIRMARDAGLTSVIDAHHKEYGSGAFDLSLYEEVTRFATLVAAAEREAIAKLIEDAPELVPFAQNDQGGCMMCGFNPKSAASYIRARGNT